MYLDPSVTGAAVKNSAPTTTDWGLVVRPIGGGGGGAVIVVTEPSANSTVTSVAGSATAVQLLAANPNRLGFSIYNSSAVDTLYVLANPGGTVSNVLFSVAIAPKGYYEDPYHYVGKVEGIWDHATGAALVTEYTP